MQINIFCEIEKRSSKIELPNIIIWIFLMKNVNLKFVLELHTLINIWDSDIPCNSLTITRIKKVVARIIWRKVSIRYIRRLGVKYFFFKYIIMIYN